jgi:hypothetical protein
MPLRRFFVYNLVGAAVRPGEPSRQDARRRHPRASKKRAAMVLGSVAPIDMETR